MPIIRSAIFFLLALNACGQSEERTMNEDMKNNPLLCDPDSGACAVPGHSTDGHTDPMGVEHAPATTIVIQYFTDPICSSCWGTEPQLRRLKAEYGNSVQVEYHMGGLVPNWDGFNSGGITKPADVAGHWDEVSHHYRMPIIGDVWVEDPLPSSYPPSIAFKAAELQDHGRALLLLRRLREMVFMEKRNIARWDVIAEAATQVGLDTTRLEQDVDGAGKALFQADLNMARALGVRGFPTFLMTNDAGDTRTVYGARAYEQFVAALMQLIPDLVAMPRPATTEELFTLHPTWCAQEAAVMLDLSHEQATEQLNELVRSGKAERFDTRNGSVWRVR
jgi:predicted DsbA family dithiol-disulfide isomerase